MVSQLRRERGREETSAQSAELQLIKQKKSKAKPEYTSPWKLLTGIKDNGQMRDLGMLHSLSKHALMFHMLNSHWSNLEWVYECVHVCFLRGSPLNSKLEWGALQTRSQIHTEALTSACSEALQQLLDSLLVSSSHTYLARHISNGLVQHYPAQWLILFSCDKLRCDVKVTHSHAYFMQTDKKSSEKAFGGGRLVKRWLSKKGELVVPVMCHVGPSFMLMHYSSVS